MNGAFHVGAIGLQAQQRALDVVSNNIANVNTPAFKRSDIRFASMLAQRADAELPTAMPDAILAAAGVTATAAMAMDEGGAIETTGQAMDLAIRGRGFIELLGPDGQILLWRGGKLALGEDGTLTDAGSGLVRSARRWRCRRGRARSPSPATARSSPPTRAARRASSAAS
ncbi:flagellar hook-basal body complex protein [Sphingomonas sp. MMS24-JH45]